MFFCFGADYFEGGVKWLQRMREFQFISVECKRMILYIVKKPKVVKSTFGKEK